MWLRHNSIFICFVDYSAYWQKDVKLQDGNDNCVKSLETVHSVLCNPHNQLLKKRKKIPLLKNLLKFVKKEEAAAEVLMLGEHLICYKQTVLKELVLKAGHHLFLKELTVSHSPLLSSNTDMHCSKNLQFFRST